MAFGLLSTGFSRKRLEDVKSEIETSLRSRLGQNINLLPQSVLGQLVGIFSEREALLWELAEAVYNSQYPDTASDVSLDNAVALTGITRLAATFSTVVLRVYGTLGTDVPQSFVASVAGTPSARFQVSQSGVIGPASDEVQKLSFSSIPTAGTYALTYAGAQTSGLSFDSDGVAIAAALNGLAALSGVTVSGSASLGFTVTFSGADGAKEHPLLAAVGSTLVSGSDAVTISLARVEAGAGPHADIPARAQAAGAIPASTGTLTVIETPTFQITAVKNLTDAEVGRELESDAEMRIRRLESLQRAGTASLEGIRTKLLQVRDVEQALIVENFTTVTDVDGRPGKSFECFVQGGDPLEIGSALFRSKPAGIETVGTITQPVTDSQGFTQLVKFSRPTEVPIYVTASIVRNNDLLEGPVYPLNGDVLVAQAILAFGETYRIGQNVITTRFYSPINTIPGVFGITVQVGTAPSPSSTTNITISPTSIAKFDSARIVVTSA